MKINADIYVKDVPGTLVAALEPISTLDGNIDGVFHNREQIISGRILVNVTFNIDQCNLERLKKEWKAKDITIVKLGEDVETFTMDYMLVGKLDAVYIESLLKKLNEEVELDSVNVGYSSKMSSESRTAMISISVHTKENLEKFSVRLGEEAKKANLMYIRGVN